PRRTRISVMHSGDLVGNVPYGLAAFFLVAFLLNVGFAVYQQFAGKPTQAAVWGIVALVFLAHAALFAALGNSSPTLPASFRGFPTWLMGLYGGQAGPILSVGLSVVGFVALIYYRRFLTDPVVAWSIFSLSLLFAGWSMTDRNFRLIVTKEDNVPI